MPSPTTLSQYRFTSGSEDESITRATNGLDGTGWQAFPFFATAMTLSVVLIALAAATLLIDQPATSPVVDAPGAIAAPVPRDVSREATQQSEPSAEMVIYIVGSRSQENAMVQALMDHAGVAANSATYQILVVNTLQDQIALHSLNQELSQAVVNRIDARVTLMDVR
jgi:hypothetical protein